MKRICKGMLCLILALSILAGMAIPAMATELKTGIGIVTTSCLRLRAKPNTDSEVIGKAYYGDAVVIIREVDDWYLVNCNLEIGYMHKDYLDLRERKNVRLGYASFDAVTNIRKGPGTDTAIVDQAPKGDVCFIIGFNCEWYKVTYEGQTGYVRSDLLTLLEKPYDNYGSPGNTYHEASSSTSSSSANSSSSSSAAASTLGEQMVAYAKNFLGYRYVWGGKDPSTSDLVRRQALRHPDRTLRQRSAQLRHLRQPRRSQARRHRPVRAYLHLLRPRHPRGHVHRQRSVHPRRQLPRRRCDLQPQRDLLFLPFHLRQTPRMIAADALPDPGAEKTSAGVRFRLF